MKEENGKVKVFDFERVFICDPPSDDRNKNRFTAVLKVIDTLLLFSNTFFNVSDFIQNYKKSVYTYEQMKTYILELIPVPNSSLNPLQAGYSSLLQGGESHLDSKIRNLFSLNFPPECPSKTLLTIKLTKFNEILEQIFKANVYYNPSDPIKVFLDYIMTYKFVQFAKYSS